MTDLIPSMPNYENFLKVSNKSLPIRALFMQLLLVQNQFKHESRLHFIESTSLSTCLNLRIFSHKVTKGFAARGKSTKGWFYGFKLHGVCSENGLLESVFFTSGNVNDSKLVERIMKNLTGSFFCDAGHFKKVKELARLVRSGWFIYAVARQDMNRLMTSK